MEELVVERPEPTRPIEEEPEQEVVPIEEPDDPEPEPSPEEDRPTEELTEVEEEETPPSAPDPPPDEIDESGEGINVRLEGVRRDYPAYYNNIIRQIFNCFRWRGGGSWEATVFFMIEREGTVADMRFLSRSGSTAFDFEAIGAVECAGQGRFGQLPDELPMIGFLCNLILGRRVRSRTDLSRDLSPTPSAGSLIGLPSRRFNGLALD
ncbi:MAG: hypothetical protein Ct9H300mP15_29950 [Gemmatimonadota bacterium]|nr:MAG: hypothetical protein Ct9H300mP15_29950 [Gemmatimonadota bacterium]